jgi:hypothetical protein
MGIWILLAIAILLILVRVREGYVDVLDEKGRVIGGPGTRPSLEDAAWRSKIDAEIPIGADESDYVASLQSFYDKIYLPLRSSNATAMVPATRVEEFLNTYIGTVDKTSLRRIIIAGFAVDKGVTGAAKEKGQTVTTGALAGFKGENLQPENGVDEVRTREEVDYKPADERKANLPEGIYSPTKQQETPRREGVHDDKSTSWTDAKFYSIE